MVDYGIHDDCRSPYGCGAACPYRKVSRCSHPDDRGRECRHCGRYVRGDDNG